MSWINRLALAAVGLSILLYLSPLARTMDWDTPVWLMLWDLYRECLVWVLPVLLALALLLLSVMIDSDPQPK